MKASTVDKFLFPHILSALIAVALGGQACHWDGSEYEKYVADNEVTSCSGFNLLSLKNGRYIRKITDNEYACGDYKSVGLVIPTTGSEICHGTDMTGCCTIDEIELAKEAMNIGICTADAHNCKTQIDEKGELRQEDFKMCSECGDRQISCDGKCVNISEDSEHCGGCNNRCDFVNKHETCVNGECNANCDGKVCIIDEIPVCKIVLNDNNNCGDCGVKCDPDTQSCQNGKCIDLDLCDMEQGEITCFATGDSDVLLNKRNSESDEKVCIHPKLSQYCGATGCSKDELGTKCDGGRICDENMNCECPVGMVFYNNQCVDPSKDATCGATKDSAGTVCTIDTGYCKFNDENGKYECLLCGNGRVRCSDKCIDPLSDNDFCGADYNCNTNSYHKCHSDQKCNNGFCLCNNEEETSCGKDNTCINLDTLDIKNQYARQHCGAKKHGQCNQEDVNSVDYKGIDCTLSNEYCVDGECKCLVPSVFCGGTCLNPLNDIMNCGVDSNCSAPADNIKKGDCTKISGSAICSEGECRCSEANLVIRMDNEGPNKGHLRCVNTSTDFYHCGLSGIDSERVCDEGEACENGFCKKISCPEGKVDCAGKCIVPADYHIRDNGQCSECAITDHEYCDDDNYIFNGCFGGFVGDNNNCSSCGDKCPINSTCSGGKCKCSNDGELCHDTDNNGYCLNLKELNLSSCSSCADGWMDVDNNLINGCELDLTNKLTMCGKEQINCTEKMLNSVNNNCVNGECEHGICNYGYGDCDNDSLMTGDELSHRNGCETRLDNEDNCGACNLKCSEYYSMNGCTERTSTGAEGRTVTEYKCCYKSKTEFDFAISKDDCCDNTANVYRKCATALCWGWFDDKDKWQCASEKPTGWH